MICALNWAIWHHFCCTGVTCRSMLSLWLKNLGSIPSISYGYHANTSTWVCKHVSIYFCKDFGISHPSWVTCLFCISIDTSRVDFPVSYYCWGSFGVCRIWGFNCYLVKKCVKDWTPPTYVLVLSTAIWHFLAVSWSPIISTIPLSIAILIFGGR